MSLAIEKVRAGIVVWPDRNQFIKAGFNLVESPQTLLRLGKQILTQSLRFQSSLITLDSFLL